MAKTKQKRPKDRKLAAQIPLKQELNTGAPER
jgi:hypothetical protein